MTTRSTGTTSVWGDSQTSETRRLYKEGVIAGTLGAATIAIWFLLLDLLWGRPLYTPTVLGTFLFTGGTGLETPESLHVPFGIVGAFTSVHWLIFVIIGVIASRLLGLAEHNPNLGFGILLLFVVFEGGFLGVAMAFAQPVLRALAWQSVLVGNLLAAIAMGGYLWRRHPHMVIYP
jgi:hypothetical protein